MVHAKPPCTESQVKGIDGLSSSNENWKSALGSIKHAGSSFLRLNEVQEKISENLLLMGCYLLVACRELLTSANSCTNLDRHNEKLAGSIEELCSRSHPQDRLEPSYVGRSCRLKYDTSCYPRYYFWSSMCAKCRTTVTGSNV